MNMYKVLYASLLMVVILLAGCTGNVAKEEPNLVQSETQEPSLPKSETQEETIQKQDIKDTPGAILSTIEFESSVIPETGESVYYVVVGSVNDDTVVSVRYIAPSEATIGSRPWSQGQKCISWDASYDWMSANVRTIEYTVKLIAGKDAGISTSDIFVTKSQKAFEDYKKDNCGE